MAHTSNFHGLTSRCKVPTSRPHLSSDPEGRAGSSVADGLRIATKADTGRLCSTNLHRLVTKPGIKFFLRCQCCRPMACRLPLKKKNELRRARTPSRCRGSAAGLINAVWSNTDPQPQLKKIGSAASRWMREQILLGVPYVTGRLGGSP